MMWDYRATALRAIDGDTIRLLIDLGFYTRHEIDIRLADVNAPELDQPGGPEARTFTHTWLDEHAGTGSWPLQVHTETTHVAEPTEIRSFTRYIGHITHPATGANLNDDLTQFLAP